VAEEKLRQFYLPVALPGGLQCIGIGAFPVVEIADEINL
jgi:hypothetical protein